MIDWREKMRDFLIKFGTDGVKQRDIVGYLANVATADEIQAHLEAWRAEGKVERFTVPTKGRSATIWRATTRILDELPSNEPDPEDALPLLEPDEDDGVVLVEDEPRSLEPKPKKKTKSKAVAIITKPKLRPRP